MGMEVWNESNEGRSQPERRSRIRRFLDRQSALFLIPAAPFVFIIFTSLGFKISGSSQAIEGLRQADTARVHSIDSIKTDVLALTHRMDGIDSRLGFIAYLGCLQARRYDQSPVLLRECKLVALNQDPE